MKYVLVICILLLVVLFILRKFSSPYYMAMKVGKPGVGKSTLMMKDVIQHLKHGWYVYTNEYIPGTYHISLEDIPHTHFQTPCFLAIDEAGIDFSNRNYKKTSMDLLAFFKEHRHLKVRMFLYSQAYDVEVAIRRLCQRFSLLKRIGPISIERKITIKQVLIDATGMSESRIADNLTKVPVLLGGIRLTWMPRYWKYFDSYDISRLNLKDTVCTYTDYPPGIRVGRKLLRIRNKHKPLLRESDTVEQQESEEAPEAPN